LREQLVTARTGNRSVLLAGATVLDLLGPGVLCRLGHAVLAWMVLLDGAPPKAMYE
jgi:hypothetical protein